MFHHKVLILVLMSVLIDFLIVIANATLNSQCNLESVFSSKLVSVEENAENSRVILGGTDRPVLMGPISDDEPDGAFVAVFDFFMTYKGSQFMDNRYLEDVGNSGTVNITFTSRPLIDCQIAQVPTKYIIFCDVVDNELVAHSVAKWDQETDQRVWMAVGWTKWSEWSTCSVSCGKGIQQRLRYCTVEKCEGYNVEQRHCNLFGLMNSQIRIRVGEHDFSNVEEMLPHVERGVVSKIVHPKYNFYTYEYDLALVKLDKPLDFAPHIMPICLPASDDLLVGENATVTGWGRLSEGGLLPTVLQEVHVPILSNEDCKSMFLQAGRHEYIPDIFLCAGHETGGKDSCQGDSGGPLQVRGKDGRYFLAGIISWGIGCAEKYLPGVCTRISKFVPWILKNVT